MFESLRRSFDLWLKSPERRRSALIGATLMGSVLLLEAGFVYLMGPSILAWAQSPATDVKNLIIFGVLVLARLLVGLVQSSWQLRFQSQLLVETQENIIESLHRRGTSPELEKSSSDWIHLLTEQCEDFVAFSNEVMSFFVSISFVILYLFYMAPVTWPITLAILLGLALILGAFKWINQRVSTEAEKRLDLNQRFFTWMDEQVRFFESIFVSRSFSQHLKRFQALKDNFLKSSSRLGFFRQLPAGLAEVFLILILIILIEAFRPQDGWNSSSLIASFYVAYRLQARLVNLIGSWSNLRELQIPFENVYRHSSQKLGVELTEATPGPLGAVLKGVRFQFPTGFSLEIPKLELPGQGIVAVVGPNGSGKTTLLRVLAGLYKPQDGTVAWETRLKNAPRVWVGSMAAIYQTDLLWNLTEGSKLEPQTVKELASDLGLPLNRVDSEKLKPYSRGEVKKIEIARCLLKEPLVVFLDEGLESLDRQTQTRVMERLRQKGTLVIWACHDPKAHSLADCVVELDGGRLGNTKYCVNF